MNSSVFESEHISPWPHRWAVALVCVAFPLIWVGGLVTTYDAGMAVPDWPNTYGYNLFLYPWQTWLYGPWGLFIEHGHRLLGSLVGMLAIALVVSAWWCQRSALVRALSALTLAGVVIQGVLGGVRVIEDQVQMAKIHGCFGPAVFALAVGVATMTSRRWRDAVRYDTAALSKIERLALLTTVLAYVQLVLGSQLRHLPSGGLPGDFRIMLFFHLATAFALLAHAVLLAAITYRETRYVPWLLRPAGALWVLIGIEIGLGAATWVTKYGPPGWLARYDWAAGYLVLADSPPQAWITTAHVATGSLILAMSLLVLLRAARLARRGTRMLSAGGARLVETLA